MNTTNHRNPTIVIATKNPGKIAEFRRLLEPTGLSALGLADLDTETTEPEETGSTFLDNATIKAIDYAKQTGLPCLADDSGLIVDALGGAPGVISSHYAWDGETTGEPDTLTRQERDQRNNQKLLQELASTPDQRRTARFTCTMVLAHRGTVLATSTGTFEGRIGSPPRVPDGDQGFGYDPLFLVAPDFATTSAKLDPDTKNTLSHRGHALREMISHLQSLDLS